MMPVLQIMWLLVNADRWAMARGAVLSVLVLVMGAALLGLSGWFITATGLAGLAGLGIAFDVFRPSAGVRFLALGRTAARYGERLLTHDATLRALAVLRVVLLRGYAKTDARDLMRLRGEDAVMRIVSDVDALDGLILRLVLPVGASVVTHIAVFVVLNWLVGWSVAIVILAGYMPAAMIILVHLARRAIAPSAEAEETGQDLRRGVIDMIRDRRALILSGRLVGQEERLLDLDDKARIAARRLDRAERDAGFVLSFLVTLVAAAALLAGARLLESGETGPALAVIGFFAALALAETILPLRRGFAELGRMTGASRRIAPHVSRSCGAPVTSASPDAPLLRIERSNLKRALAAGEAAVITGPSGAGKSTLLMQIAGLDDDTGILVKGRKPKAWPEAALREVVSALPQRSSLIAGTVRDNLSLAGDFDDTAMWVALKAVCLSDDICARGGLDARLGESGAGLSGGQARRLALARSLLKRPDILLLDEPTEGLDATTAQAVLQGLRDMLPDALIIAAMHRGDDHEIFDRNIRLNAPNGDDVTVGPIRFDR